MAREAASEVRGDQEPDDGEEEVMAWTYFEG